MYDTFIITINNIASNIVIISIISTDHAGGHENARCSMQLFWGLLQLCCKIMTIHFNL